MTRIDRAGPSQVVVADGRCYVVDCGERTSVRLLEAEIRPQRTTRLLFTHLHSDHRLGYAHFAIAGWLQGREDLLVLGPAGTERHHQLLVGQVYAEDLAYRLSLGREPSGLLDAEPRDVGHGVIVEEDDVRITAAWVEHSVPTLAYRFDSGGHSVVISGDTTECQGLIALARGADVLVQDCTLDPVSRTSFAAAPKRRRLWEQLAHQHCTPAQAARVAAAAGVRTLVLTHFMPLAEPESTLACARREFDGEILFGRDLLEIGT
jgi:ribonuclease BN (tRNA processing enzyme)